MYNTISPGVIAAQLSFLNSKAKERVYIGTRGTGKTWLAAQVAQDLVNTPGIGSGIIYCAPTQFHLDYFSKTYPGLTKRIWFIKHDDIPKADLNFYGKFKYVILDNVEQMDPRVFTDWVVPARANVCAMFDELNQKANSGMQRFLSNVLNRAVATDNEILAVIWANGKTPISPVPPPSTVVPERPAATPLICPKCKSTAFYADGDARTFNCASCDYRITWAQMYFNQTKEESRADRGVKLNTDCFGCGNRDYYVRGMGVGENLYYECSKCGFKISAPMMEARLQLERYREKVVIPERPSRGYFTNLPCPKCKGPLYYSADWLVCRGCDSVFSEEGLLGNPINRATTSDGIALPRIAMPCPKCRDIMLFGTNPDEELYQCTRCREGRTLAEAVRSLEKYLIRRCPDCDRVMMSQRVSVNGVWKSLLTCTGCGRSIMQGAVTFAPEEKRKLGKRPIRLED